MPLICNEQSPELFAEPLLCDPVAAALPLAQERGQISSCCHAYLQATEVSDVWIL